MPTQRSRIALTEAEQAELIAESRGLVVSSINRDGRPHLVPMWFVVDDEGLITFTTYGTSQKVRNLERDPRLTVLIEAGTTYGELRGISIDAEAEIVRDPVVTGRARALSIAKQAGKPRPEPDPAAPLPPEGYKRVTIRVHPLRVRSWDHRKLG